MIPTGDPWMSPHRGTLGHAANPQTWVRRRRPIAASFKCALPGWRRFVGPLQRCTVAREIRTPPPPAENGTPATTLTARGGWVATAGFNPPPSAMVRDRPGLEDRYKDGYE